MQLSDLPDEVRSAYRQSLVDKVNEVKAKMTCSTMNLKLWSELLSLCMTRLNEWDNYSKGDYKISIVCHKNV